MKLLSFIPIGVDLHAVHAEPRIYFDFDNIMGRRLLEGVDGRIGNLLSEEELAHEVGGATMRLLIEVLLGFKRRAFIHLVLFVLVHGDLLLLLLLRRHECL